MYRNRRGGGYRRRRPYSRRRKFGGKKRYDGARHPRSRMGPPGQAMGILSRIPRLRSFGPPVQRFKLVKLKCTMELGSPWATDWSITGSGTSVTAGNVARYPLQPFEIQLPLTGAFPGTGTGISNNPPTRYTTSLGSQGEHYRWYNEMYDQYNEYQPMGYKYTIKVRPPNLTNIPHALAQTRIGVLLAYKDKDSSDVVLPVVNSDANHTELDTWCAFPGVKWARVPSVYLSQSKWPTFKGFVKARDVATTGSANSMIKNWYPIRSNITDPATGLGGNMLPTLWIWAGNPRETLSSTGTNEAIITVTFTMFARVRNMLTRDAMADQPVQPVEP